MKNKNFKARLSLCMIVKNEAHNLEDLIKPLNCVLDEIIVIDTGSTDKTKEVAKGLGGKVFDFPWCNDFSSARNESIRYATGDYILWLDADDRLEPHDIKKLEDLKRKFPKQRNQAYYFVINSDGIDGNTQFLQLRVFPNIKGVKFEGRIHEQVYPSLTRLGIKFVRTDITIHHTGYHDPNISREKSERNLKIILEGLKSDQENLHLHYHAGRTLAGLNRHSEAIGHMEKIFENKVIRQKDKQFFLTSGILLGKYYSEVNLYDRAISIFEDLKKDFKGVSLLHILLGITYYLAEDYKKAQEELEKSLSMDLDVTLFPVNIKQIQFYQYYTLGQCYLKKGDVSYAKEMFLKSLNLHQDRYKSLEILGMLSLREQRYKDAVEFYKMAIETGKHLDQNYSNLGLALKKIGALKEAEDAFKKSLEINPERIEALTNLAHLYYEIKDYEKASYFFNRALALDKGLMNARVILSEIYFRQYDIDNLVKHCDALLEMLGLPRNLVIESFEDLTCLYSKIGKALYDKGLNGVSLMAYFVSFLIKPEQSILEMIIEIGKLSGELDKVFRMVEEALNFHENNYKNIGFLEKV